MEASELTARVKTQGALAVASRVRLLDELRASARSMDARELAAACGLHVSTVRFHLDVLTEAGLVRSQSESPRARGRPRLLYLPVTGGEAVDDAGSEAKRPGYELLALVLAAHWAETPAERAWRAEQAGWAVARKQGFGPQRSPGRTAEQSVSLVSGLFAELGFEPEVLRQARDFQIRLRACPFRAVAKEYPEVVCSLHLGLLRGALAELGAPLTARSLHPFVEPHLCVAHVSHAHVSPATATQGAEQPPTSTGVSSP